MFVTHTGFQQLSEAMLCELAVLLASDCRLSSCVTAGLNCCRLEQLVDTGHCWRTVRITEPCDLLKSETDAPSFLTREASNTSNVNNVSNI